MKILSKVLIFVMLVTVFLGTIPSTLAMAATTTFTELTFSDPKLENPFRGYHFKNQLISSEDNNYAFKDIYDRCAWSDLEKKQADGTYAYDFTWIENLANKAAASKGVMGFRFRAVTTMADGKLVPDYITKGNWAYSTDVYKKTHYFFTPEWNDELFVSSMEKLIAELGRVYDNDPRIGWVDIGGYGNFAEWHVSGLPGEPATKETKKRIIDAFLKAFPHKRLVMPTADWWSHKYAMSASPEIGWRRDNFMCSWFGALNVSSSKDRWKTAPVIAEPINYTKVVESMALPQILDYHIASINRINFTSITDEARKQVVHEAEKYSGYRFGMKDVTFPTSITTGTNFNISANWMNTGITPSYMAWDVTYQLQTNNTLDSVVWQGASTLNLQNFLPATTPKSVTDTFKLPSNVPAGTYKMVVLVKDPSPTGYFDPMQLAMTNRSSAGYYTIGNVTVSQDSSTGTGPVAVIKPIPASQETFQYINLDGTGSYGRDGYITTYKWDITSPNGFSHTIYGAAQKFVPIRPDAYTIKLTVTDNLGHTATTSSSMGALPTPSPTPEPVFSGLTLSPIADTYVKDGSESDTNQGGETIWMKYGGADSGDNRHSFIKFDLSAVTGTVTSAKLKLFTHYRGASFDMPISVYPVTNDSWTETGLTWNNMPSVSSTATTTTTINDTGEWFTFDITSYINSQSLGDDIASICLKIEPGLSEGCSFFSKEANEYAECRPKLEILTSTMATPTPTPTPIPSVTITVTPSADSFIQDGSNSGTNFGTNVDLVVKDGGSGFDRYSYLKFNVNGISGNVTDAKLKLYANRKDYLSTPVPVTVYPVNSDGWMENGITWSTAPVPESSATTTVTVNDSGAWYTFNITFLWTARSKVIRI